ncbi:MAG: leucine-rich repeat protein [Candidatus Lokiarchaeota archaeon]|nr:leucine-rich repeat protein [Candidatus Lokiarchaeota archaeon]
MKLLFVTSQSDRTHFNLSTDIPRHTEIIEIDLGFLRKYPNLTSVKINHGERLKQLDLRVLGQCKKLKKLEISHLWSLKEISLDPLSECSSLQEFKLNWNSSLKELNLQPLASCKNLQHLEIRWNGALRELDLEPLAHCKQLRSFQFTRSSHHQSTNLTPLVWCSNLRELRVDGNSHADSILTFHPAIRSSDFSCNLFYPSVLLKEYVEKNGWGLLFSLMNDDIYLDDVSLIQLQYRWFAAFGLNEFGVFDGDIRKQLEAIPDSYNFQEIFNQVKKRIQNCMIEQIRNNGPTRHMDVEKLKSSIGVIMIPHIVRRRREEIENLVIAKEYDLSIKDRFDISQEYYDLGPLWVTHYGYEILSALEMNVVAKKYEIEEIKDALRRIGLEIEIGPRSIYSVEMSKAMKEYLVTKR